MKTGIYTITNLINNKIYVGYATDIISRISGHKYQLNNNIHDNHYLQNSWNKYGENSFEFEVLVECKKELLASEEHYWANMLNTHNMNYGYNIKPTHPDNYSICTKEIREKISKANKGRKASIETRQKLSEYHKRNPMSEERKKLLIESRKNVKISEEGRKRINEGIKNAVRKPKSQELRNNISKKMIELWDKKRQETMSLLMQQEWIKNREEKLKGINKVKKSVLQYDLQGNFIKEWESIISIERELGYNSDFIIKCAKGTKEKFKNFKWKYKIAGTTTENV